MQWRFTIIDRNNQKTVIDEPNGWPEFFVRLKRHPERHGTFREIQGNSFQFFDAASWLLKAEYEAYGAKGMMNLSIDLYTDKGYQNFYYGLFNFPSYKFSCEENCYCEIDVDQTGALVDLINRFEQPVDITKLKCFDGTTDLTPYPFMNFDIILPSKAIFQRAEARTKNDPSAFYSILTDSNFNNLDDAANKGIITPKFDEIVLDEISQFTPSIQFDYINYTDTTSFNNAVDSQPIMVISPESILQGDNLYNIQINLQGQFIAKYIPDGVPNTPPVTQQIEVHLKLTIRCLYGNKIDLFTPIVIENFTDNRVQGDPMITVWTPINFTYGGDIVLKRNDNVSLFIQLEEIHFSNTNLSPWKNLDISFTTASYFKMNSSTLADPTNSKAFMLNETISRVIESITDNQLKLYSEYFGRNDSKPYSFSVNGCGSQRMITNGLQIRNVRLPDGSIPGVFLSLKDIFEALRATDNIGMGEENNTIRFENWKYFYKTNIIHECLDVAKIKRETQAAEIYSTFKFGYDKWETENYNGLDEFLTNREYRLDIPQVKSTLEQICKWIISGYSIEVTRRMGNTSTDWRYDNNIFMICVEPNGAAYKVELNNILSPQNLIDPPTIYNFRLSPLRNALRWFNKVIGSYRNVNTGHKIIFAAAEGNYVAEGNLLSVTCKLEAGTIKENQDLTIAMFANQADGLPFLLPERVKFSYPLGSNEYRNIALNPYGLIAFSSVCDKGRGWIDELSYKPNEGMGDFTLIPQI